jgi:4-hydroxy-tetrahydrodipicolinate reductase
MVKAIVSGVAGRMGGRIVHLMEGVEGLSLAGALESPGHAALGKDVGEVVGLPRKGIAVVDSLIQVLPQAEVVIEFTHPEPSLTHLHEVADAGKAMVLGTTGFSPPQIAEINALASRAHLVFAPNMSVGVNLMFKVVADIARVLGEGYDVEIVEAHHRLKKDATASSASAPVRRSASRRSGPGTSSGSTRCCSAALANAWRSSTGPTAGTISPGGRCGRRSG